MENKFEQLLHRLRIKYKLVILNDETFEEKASLRLSRLNVFIVISVALLIFVFLFVTVVITTPLREYIPGYADVNLRRDLTNMTYKADSLEKLVSSRDLYIKNVIGILSGDLENLPGKKGSEKLKEEEPIALQEAEKTISGDEEAFREKVEAETQFAVLPLETKVSRNSINTYFTPVQGIVSSKYNVQKGHYGVDIVGAANESIKSVLDGTVVFSEYTPETGHVIAVMHKNNILSFYKHNSVLLRKVGNFVRAGEVIAIIGNSGEMSTGPHLHFELWFNGSPVDPENYIKF